MVIVDLLKFNIGPVMINTENWTWVARSTSNPMSQLKYFHWKNTIGLIKTSDIFSKQSTRLFFTLIQIQNHYIFVLIITKKQVYKHYTWADSIGNNLGKISRKIKLRRQSSEIAKFGENVLLRLQLRVYNMFINSNFIE